MEGRTSGAFEEAGQRKNRLREKKERRESNAEMGC